MRNCKDQIVNRIKSIDHLTFWCYNRYVCDYKDGKIESYYTQEIPDDDSVYWSDIEELDNPDLSDIDNIYIMHDYCQMSDYSGSLVEKSNTEILTGEYGFIGVYGDYGSISCMIGIQSLIDMPKEESERILDLLEGLNDYPLIDEEELSDNEMNYIDESWNNWGEYDFKRAIGLKFNLDISDYKLKSDSSLRELFDNLAVKANEYWDNESGYNMYINIDNIVKVMSIDDFNTYFELDNNNEV